MPRAQRADPIPWAAKAYRRQRSKPDEFDNATAIARAFVALSVALPQGFWFDGLERDASADPRVRWRAWAGGHTFVITGTGPSISAAIDALADLVVSATMQKDA